MVPVSRFNIKMRLRRRLRMREQRLREAAHHFWIIADDKVIDHDGDIGELALRHGAMQPYERVVANPAEAIEEATN